MMPANDDEFDPLDMVIKLILDAVEQQQLDLEQAGFQVKRSLAKTPFLASVDEALSILRDRQKRHLQASTASSVVKSDSYADGAWYLGPKEHGHWARYRDLLDSLGSPDLAGLDEETSRIVALLAPPNAPDAKRRGLVMGNVQSGKTRNFAGVIAKAADAGYAIVIVLSGINNNLREQTQSRLTDQLFTNGPSATDWYPLTGSEHDFEPTAVTLHNLVQHQPLLCAVVKKNTDRLGALVKAFKTVPSELLRKKPVLVVDDEADQATPNSLAEKKKLSAINKHLRQLWNCFPTGTYVAYTATPFANVLIDPEDKDDLFPADFVTTISPGSGYFGAERVFGVYEVADGEAGSSDGVDMVRTIPDADTATLKPPSNASLRVHFDPPLPASLLAALDWYLLATAARRARGDTGHSSMLIHTTHYKDPHFAMKTRVEHELREYSELGGPLLERLRGRWDEEKDRAAGEASAPLPAWDEVLDHLPKVARAVRVIVDNGDSDDRLNYVGKDALCVIAVGGGTLSRGLTLEGLVVSYFTRTSNTYDTLLQMGRWFGYRTGYEDLPRVWVTRGLDKDYAFLARVEKDLRDEIEAIQNSEYSPQQLGVKIRSHPGRLQITSSNKMFHAGVAQLGLSGTSDQTFLFDATSPGIIESNVVEVERMIEGAERSETASGTPSLMYRGVSGVRVAAFLEAFSTHPDQKWLYAAENKAKIAEWITNWAPGPNWNVVLVDTAPKAGATPRAVTISGTTLRCAQRSAMKGSTPSKIDLKAITSASDRLRDIPAAAYVSQKPKRNADFIRTRRLHGDGKGLIVVYPIEISKTPSSSERIGMEIDTPLLGFAIFYPILNDESSLTSGAFVSVKQTWNVPDTVEGDDEQETTEEMADA